MTDTGEWGFAKYGDGRFDGSNNIEDYAIYSGVVKAIQYSNTVRGYIIN